MTLTSQKHLILQGVEDAGMQGIVRAVIGPDFSSLLVSEDLIHEEWGNPEPVAVLLQPVFDPVSQRLGLLVGKRNIQPKIGEWALPGGFMARGETPEEGAVREFEEEVGIKGLTADTVRILTTYPTPNGRLLIFCVNYHALVSTEIEEMLSGGLGDSEMSEFRIAYEREELAFPFHTAVANKFFQNTHGRVAYPGTGHGVIASRGYSPQRD